MKYLDKLLNIISIGILIIDHKGNIYFSNSKANKFLDTYRNHFKHTQPIMNLLEKIKENTSLEITLATKQFVLKNSILDDTNKTYGIIIFDIKDLSKFFPNTNLEEFRTILDSAQDAIFIDDMFGNTEWVNKACEDLYQIRKEDIIGKNIDFLEKQGIFSPSVAKLVFQKKQEVSILHSNKQGKQLLTTGTPIFDNKGKIKKVISTSRDITELIHLRNQLEDIQNELIELKEKEQENLGDLIVKSHKMREVIQLAKRLAQIDSTVLITGESGVGKGVISKYIHELGNRSDKPFVKVNCGAIPEALLESELFGYEHGAFTGSKRQGKIGLFELANNGTIFLDEIGELPLHLQVKILQVIQDKTIQRVGGVKTIPIDVRIITATNKNLREMVEKKQFRKDLFYRLNVVPIHIPPLSERKEDIFPLVRHFLRKYNEKFNEKKRIDPNAMAYLIKYSWPGNVRELENIIERLVITTKGTTILPQNLPNYIVHSEENSCDVKIPSMMNLKKALEEVERQIIHNAVIKYKTTRNIAKALGVSQPTIVRKMSKYNMTDTELNHIDT
ncbi:sigma-54 interaction domain-containing protein [Crassaminicella thermophila]|nr:sigma 54-interacting transcriptional regulator [Crassaminicella thermophila]